MNSTCRCCLIFIYLALKRSEKLSVAVSARSPRRRDAIAMLLFDASCVCMPDDSVPSILLCSWLALSLIPLMIVYCFFSSSWKRKKVFAFDQPIVWTTMRRGNGTAVEKCRERRAVRHCGPSSKTNFFSFPSKFSFRGPL